MGEIFSQFSTGQLFALFGAVISGIMFFANGFKEKQEGKDIGRKEVREEWQKGEAEAHRRIKEQEDETIKMVDAVNRNVDQRRDDDGLSDGFYTLPDHHYEQ